MSNLERVLSLMSEVGSAQVGTVAKHLTLNRVDVIEVLEPLRAQGWIECGGSGWWRLAALGEARLTARALREMEAAVERARFHSIDPAVVERVKRRGYAS